MNNFITRSLTAIIFGAVIIVGLIFNSWSYLTITGIVLLGSLLEFFKISSPMYRRDKNHSDLYRNIMIPMAMLFFVISFFIAQNRLESKYLFIAPIFIAIFFNIELFLKSARPFRNIGLNIMALYYVALPMCLIHFVGFTNGQFTGAIVLAIMFIIWGNDSGAYIIGSLIGRKKLLPHVSPNKSIEGFIGGGLFCFLLAYLNINFLHKLTWFESLTLIKPLTWYLIALVIFLFATMGDLVESLLKRSLNIKDSGSILPGHGGFLDRFDAFLFVMPFIVAIVKIFN
jgi:phosphatidate cytidylyltransferase